MVCDADESSGLHPTLCKLAHAQSHTSTGHKPRCALLPLGPVTPAGNAIVLKHNEVHQGEVYIYIYVHTIQYTIYTGASAIFASSIGSATSSTPACRHNRPLENGSHVQVWNQNTPCQGFEACCAPFSSAGDGAPAPCPRLRWPVHAHSTWSDMIWGTCKAFGYHKCSC